jgi:hypothetical protein
VVNRVSLRPLIKKAPYELWIGRMPNFSYFRVFGSKCFVLNEAPKVIKFDSKSIERVFVGYIPPQVKPIESTYQHHRLW